MSDVLQYKKKRYEVSDELGSLAAEVVSVKRLDFTPAKIKYVKVYPLINKRTVGRCMLARPMIKLFGECDYIIQMSGDLWDKLDDDRKKILMWHELKHVLPVQNSKTGEWDFKLRDHDVQDFMEIINEHGVSWLTDLKTLFSSVYDLDKVDSLTL